jgi:hypothetical protein
LLFPTCNRTIFIAEEKVLDLRRVWMVGMLWEETYSYFRGHQVDLVENKDEVLVRCFCANVLFD